MLVIEKIEELIEMHIFRGANNLIEYLQYDVECNEVNIENWKNIYEDTEDGECMQKEILEYWVVSDFLYRRLDFKDEAVIDVFGLKIWGRCGSGYPISHGSVIKEIFEEWCK